MRNVIVVFLFDRLTTQCTFIFTRFEIHIKLLLKLQIEQKRKKLKKESRNAEGIPEDDPIKYKHAVYVMTMKV